MSDAPELLRPFHSEVRRVRAVVNADSGSVPAGAAAKLGEILESFGLEAHVAAAAPSEIVEAVKAARADDPDLLIVLAGDGTAALAAQCCGPDGPLLICLPGGTMNMLPFALHGRGGWEEVLKRTLASGSPRIVSGGELDGHPFYVAAIIGAPTMWAKAREAVRKGDLKRAWMRGIHALKNAFAGRLRFSLEDGPRRKAEALTLMTPLCSTAVGCDEQALEAAVLDVKGAVQAISLGFNMVTGDWRRDPNVATQLISSGHVWAHRRVTAILDGETVRFDHDVEIQFKPVAFRALVATSST